MRWVVLLALWAGWGGGGCWRERAAGEIGPAPVAERAQSTERPPPEWAARGRMHAPRREQDRCTQVIGRFFELAAQDMQGKGFSGGMLEEIETAMIDSCKETAWSVESLACYEGAGTLSDAGNCFQAMPAEQREDFDRRFREIRQQHRALPQPSAGTP